MAVHGGALVFAIGSFPLYAQNVDPGQVGITFGVGSAFFTGAAASQLVQTPRATTTTTDRRLNTTVVNMGTLAGALCFLAGAYLLLPARPALMS